MQVRDGTCTPISIPYSEVSRQAAATCSFTAATPTATATLSTTYSSNFTLAITNASNSSQSSGYARVDVAGSITDNSLDTAGNFPDPALFQITNTGSLIYIDQNNAQNNQPFAKDFNTPRVGPAITLIKTTSRYNVGASYEFFLDSTNNRLVSQKKETCFRRIFCLSNQNSYDYDAESNVTGNRIRLYDSRRQSVTAGYPCTPVDLTVNYYF